MKHNSFHQAEGGAPTAVPQNRPQDIAAPGRSGALQRLHTVFQKNVFPTDGPHEEVLKLLLATCKTLVESQLYTHEEVQTANEKMNFVESVEGKLNESHQASRKMADCAKKVSFLWAAQGLGDLSVESRYAEALNPNAELPPSNASDWSGTHMAQSPLRNGGNMLRQHPQQAASNVSGAPGMPNNTNHYPSHFSSFSSPISPSKMTPHHQQQQQQQQGPPPPSSMASHHHPPGSIVDSLVAAQSVEDVLRQSLETTAAMEGQVKRIKEQREKNDLADRLSTVEDCMETVYRSSLKVQTDVAKHEAKISELHEGLRQVGHRISALADKMNAISVDLEKLDKKETKDLHTMARHHHDTRCSLDSVNQSIASLVEQSKATGAELMDIRTTRPSFTDVKGIVAALKLKSYETGFGGEGGETSVADGATPSTAGAGNPSSSSRSGLSTTLLGVSKEVAALYTVLDLPKEEVQNLLAPFYSSQQQQQQQQQQGHSGYATPRRSSGRGGLDLSSASAGGVAKIPAAECLKLVHGGLPFKVLANSNAKLQDQCTTLQGQIETLVSRAPNKPPLLGMEVADTEDGVKVVRLFKGLPAQNAGMVEGDVVVAFGGTATPTREAFSKAAQNVANTVALQPPPPVPTSSAGPGSRSRSAGQRTPPASPVTVVHIMRAGRLVELTLAMG